MADNQNMNEEQDLKEREYRDAQGNIHHHTHAYMDQHEGGEGESGKKGGQSRGQGDQGKGGQGKGSQDESKTSHEKHVEAGRKGGEH